MTTREQRDRIGRIRADLAAISAALVDELLERPDGVHLPRVLERGDYRLHVAVEMVRTEKEVTP